MKKREWSVRAYREGDEAEIYRLHQAVHPSEQRDQDEWMKWWRWLYKQNPAGESRMRLAEANGRIVAQHAIIPVRLKIGRQIVTGSQSLDTMTHPDYRRRGLFETLARGLYSDAARVGINTVYCFPNNLSHPGFIKKLDWFDVSIMKVMFKPVSWRNTVGLKIKNRLLSGSLAVGATLVFDKILFRTREVPAIDRLAVTQVTSFDERFDRLWSRVSGQYAIMVARNKDYLNWRFSAPGSHYLIFAAEKADEVRGYLVLGDRMLRNTKASFIFDMIAESDEVMHCLVSEAVRACQRAGVDLILYGLIAGRTYHRVLRSNGFISSPFTKSGYFCAYSSATQISRAFLEDSKNWLVQTADSDTL